ncbi:MAG TPA: hypothetical protein P5081_00975 [Phycisphaerae bacterium]|nr:hypothetical protein [Phycisphaerae bacterium]HRW51425.1 hypothetical protein [Phycisphaerae bacterium]
MFSPKFPIVSFLVVLFLIPVLMGTECAVRVPVGTPFSSIELEQYGGCVDDQLPARIVVRRLSDGHYQLEISEFTAPAAEPADGLSCYAVHGHITEDGCELPGDAMTRLLTSEEMQQVDDVVRVLEADYYASFAEIQCADSSCATLDRWINGVKLGRQCDPGAKLVITPESADSIRTLMASLRNE